MNIVNLDVYTECLKDPEDIHWILEHLESVLGNAGLTSLLKDE